MSPRRTAKCRSCYRPQIVKRDGRLFRHTRGSETCPGSNTEVR